MELALISATPELGYDMTYEQSAFARRPSNPPLAEDWARFQDVILKMYVEDERPLPEVRLFMETCYSFFASERMYKRRFDKWDVKKNYTQDDVDNLVNDIIQNRVGIDDATIHGKPVNWDRVLRHLDDSTLSQLPDLKKSARSVVRKPRRRSSASTASIISYESVDSRQNEVPVSPVLSVCSKMRDGGRLLQELDSYLDSNPLFSGTDSIFGPAGSLSRTSHSQVFLHPAQFNQNYARGMVLVRNGHRKAGNALLAQAARALDDLFTSQHPALINCFLDAFVDANHETHPEGRQFVTEHAVKAVRKALPSTHPLVALCDFVQMTIRSKAEMEHLLWFSQKFCDLFSKRLNKQQKVPAYVNLKHFAKLMQVRQFDLAYDHLTNHVEPTFVNFLNSGNVPKEMRPAALCYLRRRAHLLSNGDLENARQSLELAVTLTLAWLDDSEFSICGNPLFEETFRLIDEVADFKRQTGDPDRALQIHAFALEMCTAVRGQQDGKTMRMVSVLAEHYDEFVHADLILNMRLRFPEVFETENTLDSVSHILPCPNCGNGQDTQNFCEDHRALPEVTAADRSRVRVAKEHLRRLF